MDRLLCAHRPVHTSLTRAQGVTRAQGEGTPENAAFGRARLCADLPCDWTEEEGILSKVHKGWGLSYSPLSSLFWAAGPFSAQDDLCLLPSSRIKQRLKVCGNNTKRYKIVYLI